MLSLPPERNPDAYPKKISASWQSLSHFSHRYPYIFYHHCKSGEKSDSCLWEYHVSLIIKVHWESFTKENFCNMLIVTAFARNHSQT